MDGKTKSKIVNFLLFSFLVAYPFGQLLTFNLAAGVRIHLIDLLVLPNLFLINPKYLKDKRLFGLLFVLGFTSIFALTLFQDSALVIGLVYLVRLMSYIAFFLVLYKHFVTNKTINIIQNSLIAVSTLTAVFGWYQYFVYPDLRGLYYLGWDDHWYRLLGTFFDPAFLGLILTFGFLLSYSKFLYEKREKSLILIMVFLSFSLAFTYSRASYLALLVGLFVITLIKRDWKKFTIIVVAFLVLVMNLPRPPSAGVELERTFSIASRIENYKETFEIIKKSPVFGVGFNNLCLAKSVYLGETKTISHSCSGADSSLLFVIATTGIIGFLTILSLVLKSPVFNSKEPLFYATAVALLIHSQFSNSLFYPWIMGWMAILGALTFSRREP